MDELHKTGIYSPKSPIYLFCELNNAGIYLFVVFLNLCEYKVLKNILIQF